MLDSGLSRRPDLRPLIVLGTRPEAIKLAPVILECRRRGGIRPVVCSTGQHRELLDQVLDYFDIKPDLDLGLMTSGQSLAGLSAACLTALDQVITDYAPDCVVVQGDTTSVMTAAMAAFYRQCPVVHVEAGLRTGDLFAPWPEEFNRRVAGMVARMHCAPTQRSADALITESTPKERIRVTGNTVIDALLHAIEKERRDDTVMRQKFPQATGESVVLITGHRRENHGDGLRRICEGVKITAAAFPATQFIYPVHLNPNVQEIVNGLLGEIKNVHLVPPAGYAEFVWLMDRATVVLTDSGGVQEEAPSLDCAVLVTREKTERPEAVEAGIAELVGTDRDLIASRLAHFLQKGASGSPTRRAVNPYGDGMAAERIVDWMQEVFCSDAQVELVAHDSSPP